MNDFEKKHIVLDTVNQWIFNCDTKVSIFLATIGVFFSIILSSDIGISMVGIIRKSIDNKTVCNILFLLLLIIGFGFVVIGMYKLIRVLVPTINLKHDSVMFFGNVAKYSSFIDYCNAVDAYNEDQSNEDILHQIYAASNICAQKFKNQKHGILLSSIGILIVIIWLVLGFLVYYI